MTRGDGLRVRAARGVLVNGAFVVVLNALGLLKGFVAAALVTTSAYGVWGILSITLIAILWLKDVGVPDRFVQQDDEDQEAALQEAFSVQLLVTGGLFAAMALAMPLLALAYGRPELIAPGLALALLLPGLAFQAPLWAHYRELRFARQRSLQAIDPVVSFVLTIGLALAGAGFWSFVVATVVGTWLTALAAWRSSPHPLRWRLDRRVLRTYVRFSWPLFVYAVCGVISTQVAIFAGEAELGLAGVAAITLASTVNRSSQRMDEVLSQTLYPVVTKVRDRRDVLHESFEKSNRLALMWATPFGVGFALFAPDLVAFGLGEDWSAATEVLQLIGIAAVVNQVGFNWTAYYKGQGLTRPLAVSAVIALAVFLAVTLPLLLAYGLAGYGIGMIAVAAVNAVVRGHYLRRLFPGLSLAVHAVRSTLPTVPAVVAVLVLRASGVEGEERSLATAAGELLLFVALAGAVSLRLERDLLREIRGYVRQGSSSRTRRAGTPA